jgi:hypothetical protein
MITKEQWSEIEACLSSSFGGAKFKLGNDEISVAREHYKEGDRRLNVYLNGSIKYSHVFGEHHDEYQALVEKFWHKQTKAAFKAKDKKAYEKIYGGKKAARKAFPKLDDRIVFYFPTFKKAKTLVNQFKKIKDLEFIDKSGVAGF